MTKQTKSIAILIVLCMCLPLFSQEITPWQNYYHDDDDLDAPVTDDLNAPITREPRFDVSAMFSWYPARSVENLQSKTNRRRGAASAPFQYDADHSYNMRLNMGLNIYKEWSAYVDFGIDDQDMSRLVDFMAKFGNRFFDLSLEYTMNNGRLLAWDDTRFGTEANNAIASRPPDQILDYEATWLKVVFVLKKNIMVGGADGMPIGGFFVSRATVPVVFASETEEIKWDESSMNVPADGAAAFLDPAVDFWTIGAKIGLGGMVEPPSGGFVAEGGLFGDFGFGWCELDKELIDEAVAVNPDFEKPNGFATYFSAQLYFGMGYKFSLGRNKYLYLTGGIDASPQSYAVGGFAYGYSVPLVMRNFGYYARTRIKF